MRIPYFALFLFAVAFVLVYIGLLGGIGGILDAR